MKLSIIVPCVSEFNQLEHVIEHLKEQNNQDFEVVFVLTKPNKKAFLLLESALEFFGSRLRFIVNSKRRSIQNDIGCSIHLLRNQYVYVLLPQSEIKNNFVSTVVNKLSATPAEILEFAPNITGALKWKPKPRLKEEHLYTITEEKEAIAYAFPFIFNKIIKRSLLEQFSKYRTKEINDSQFALELLYLILANAQTYQYWNKKLVNVDIFPSASLNPANFRSQFNIILNYLQTHHIKLNYEVTYAMLYFMQIILMGCLNTREILASKLLKFILPFKGSFNEKRANKHLADLHQNLQKFHEENHEFFLTNIYIKKQLKEAEILRSLPNLDKIEDWYKSL